MGFFIRIMSYDDPSRLRHPLRLLLLFFFKRPLRCFASFVFFGFPLFALWYGVNIFIWGNREAGDFSLWLGTLGFLFIFAAAFALGGYFLFFRPILKDALFIAAFKPNLYSVGDGKITSVDKIRSRDSKGRQYVSWLTNCEFLSPSGSLITFKEDLDSWPLKKSALPVNAKIIFKTEEENHFGILGIQKQIVIKSLPTKKPISMTTKIVILFLILSFLATVVSIFLASE